MMQNTIFKEFLLKFFIFFFIIFFSILINNKYTFAIDSLNDNNILGACSNPNNCVFESWKVTNVDKSFKELIDILKNTPRIKIINIKEDYLHALATSRIMKFIDDIEIKKSEKDNILNVKSKSRTGFYDLGVNERRINTLHFRLIDIYN
tara:strand:- start:163 stop:609 length:447 start_codon:yes stop_codon:yes gene_type:complete